MIPKLGQEAIIPQNPTAKTNCFEDLIRKSSLLAGKIGDLKLQLQ